MYLLLFFQNGQIFDSKKADYDCVSQLSPEETNVIGYQHYPFLIYQDLEEETSYQYNFTVIAPNSPQLHPDENLI